MGGPQEMVEVVFLDKTLVAVLRHDVEPVAWLTRNDFMLMGEVSFGTQPLMTVPVRHASGGEVVVALVTEMPIER